MTEQATIEQMNEAIARFMGGAPISQKYWNIPDRGHILHGDEYDSHLKYHTSWDWLIPVVEKIQENEVSPKGYVVRAAAEVVIYYKACIITYEPDEDSGDTNEEVKIQTQGESKLEAVYNAVYQFIQWYNSNKS